MGVVMDSLRIFSKASSLLNTQISRYSPSGARPPRVMLRLRSGISRSSSISCTWPRPVQVGQAPYGLLKEKLLGAGSS